MMMMMMSTVCAVCMCTCTCVNTLVTSDDGLSNAGDIDTDIDTHKLSFRLF